MNSKLVQTLVERGLVKQDMMVEGKVKAAGLGQTMHLVKAELLIFGVGIDSFLCRDRLGKTYTMFYDNVTAIDGMDLYRYASVYSINPDGSIKGQGKKRGRKPKSAQINTMEGDNHGKGRGTEVHNKTEHSFA